MKPEPLNPGGLMGFLAGEPLTGELPRSFYKAVKDETDKDGVERARALAKEMLLVGEEEVTTKDGKTEVRYVDLVNRYLDCLIKTGLPTIEKSKPKKVLIVGAGITGLTAGYLLKAAGHEVTIIEANADRIGGRIKTFHKNPYNPNKPAPFKDHKQYAEAGAMRLPDIHPMVLALVDKLGLKRRYFYNVAIEPGTGKMEGPAPQVVYDPFDGSPRLTYGQVSSWEPPRKKNNTWIRTNNVQVTKSDYYDTGAKREDINKGFELSGDDVKKTTSDLLEEALKPVKERLKEYPRPTPKGDANVVEYNHEAIKNWIDAWASIIYDFDSYSMYSFLKTFAVKQNGEQLSDNEIEAIGTLENLTSRLMLSFIHCFQGLTNINAEVTYYEIEGGSWRLPYRFFQDLEPHIAMNRRMTHIEYHDLAKGKSPRHVSDRSGERVSIRCLSETQTGIDGYTYQEEVFRGDVALITIPFSSLRHVTVSPMFSYKKRRAIIELHYDAATKVLLEFSRRWWEFKNVDEWTEALKQLKSKIGEKAYQEQEELWKERDPRTDKGEFIISDYVGGGNITDNPNRFAYVPSHPVAPGNQGGVMLASYSWSDDARRWDSMADHERSQMALKGIVEIHGWQCAMFFTGVAITQSWMHSPYAFGEAAVYTPGQMTSFHLEIPKNEGPVYFAGEHVSLKHAWIEGCLETATRMALDINKLPHS